MPNILIKNPLTKQTMQPQAYPLCQAALTQLCSVSGIRNIRPRERTLTMPVATGWRQLFPREPGTPPGPAGPGHFYKQEVVRRAHEGLTNFQQLTWQQNPFAITVCPVS